MGVCSRLQGGEAGPLPILLGLWEKHVFLASFALRGSGSRGVCGHRWLHTWTSHPGRHWRLRRQMSGCCPQLWDPPRALKWPGLHLCSQDISRDVGVSHTFPQLFQDCVGPLQRERGFVVWGIIGLHKLRGRGKGLQPGQLVSWGLASLWWLRKVSCGHQAHRPKPRRGASTRPSMLRGRSVCPTGFRAPLMSSLGRSLKESVQTYLTSVKLWGNMLQGLQPPQRGLRSRCQEFL